MKFGRQFELYKIPEWLEYYFDYKGIKLILKFLDNRRVKSKKLKTLQMIKKNYIQKYTLNNAKKDYYKRQISSVTNETNSTVNILSNKMHVNQNGLF